MGWWELKPEGQLSAYEMLQFGGKDDVGDNMVELLDIIKIDVEDGYEFSEVDEEHITKQIRQGCVSGEINDWDWASEQEAEVVSK